MSRREKKRPQIGNVTYDLTREDGRLERVCEHGVGHTVGHTRGWLIGSAETIHGCDGCCETYAVMKIRNAFSTTRGPS